uniref:NADH-ubiquinone oxidoreductase chain 4 n=1 Tax=Pista cristata TaxID=279652 RepID=B3TK02_9ANNE|nr:NADH dehydrogenase subunit 4 [Pista cristata]
MLTILMTSFFLLPLPIFKMSNSWNISFISMLLLSTSSFLFIYPFSPFFFINSYAILVDFLSAPLITLTLWISSLMILASYNTLFTKKAPFLFIFMILSLNLILLLTFSQINLILFYICFEASLIPTLFLILGWGYQPERLKASFYLMIYTVAASLPLLVNLCILFYTNLSLSLLIPLWTPLPFLSALCWFFTILAFLVKMPVYLAHLWLPKAHVEAPVAGSMILAAILLKLGSYGLLRFASLYPFLNKNLSAPLIAISLCGAIVTSMICIRQPDMKSLIAYSSVGHMGLLTAGIMTSQIWGWEGAMIMMIAHGLCSSALFALANTLYETTHTRSLFLTKGLLALFPTMTLFWFMFSAANMAAPPSLNLSSEIILLSSILSSSLATAPFIAFSSFLAAVYSLFLYTATQHGSPTNFINPLSIFSQRNYILFSLHLIPLFFLFLKPDIIP